MVVNKGGLTQTEKEVLQMLTDEFLTPGKIAIRRKTTQQAVSKIIVKLKEKGYLKQGYQRVVKIDRTLQPHNHQIRLHGQEFHINILFKDNRYKSIMGKSNLLYVDGNQISLYRNAVEVRSGQVFWGDDVHKATSRSMKYWDRFLIRLENRLKILLIKHEKFNVKIVKHHYAEINNGLAKDLYIKSEKIRIYANEDGKLWFTIDNSFNLHEAEFQHPDTAIQDAADKIVPFFNDIRDRFQRPPLMSELMVMLHQAMEINKETAAGLNIIAKMLKPPTNNYVNGDKPRYIG